MPTTKQQIATQKTVENGGNVTQAMRDAGYSETTVNNPSNLTESIYFKETLRKQGLTPELVMRALVDDIKHKRGKRLGELGLASELLGMKKMAVNIATEVNIDNRAVPIDPEAKRRGNDAIEEFLSTCQCGKCDGKHGTDSVTVQSDMRPTIEDMEAYLNEIQTGI